jgi:general nucleoside transport system ATP-binding protein
MGISEALPAVEMRGITKCFPGVLANDHVDLFVRCGEVHALLGENGAGKTTLMNILAGLYAADEGEIIVQGRRVVLRSPRDAIAAGIGVIHQHFRLVDVFTVAENVTLGESHPGLKLDLRALQAQIGEICKRYGWKLDPQTRISQLCVGERQRVEILKALYHNAEILVLDEPTAVLTPQEARDLAGTLRQMAASGKAVIYISHKLHEVMEVADRITILRAGRNLTTIDRDEANERELARLMVGREVPQVEVQDTRPAGEVRLDIRDLVVGGDIAGDCEVPALNAFTLAVQAGQIVGLAGVSGNGQRELAEAIAGLRPVRSGSILLCGKDLTNRPPVEIIDAGVSLVPEDRLGMGLVRTLGVGSNAILKSYRRAPIAVGPLLNPSAVRQHAERLVQEFSVHVANLDDPVWKLSGGNLQRLLLAREMTLQPKVLVAVHPTRGLDVQATAEIHRLLLKQRDQGAAILVISEDLDELLAISDSLAVIHSGRVMGEFARSEADIEKIGLMMLGFQAAEAAA